MSMDALVKMLSCVAADGRIENHAIIRDREAEKAPNALSKIIIQEIRQNELLILPDEGRLKLGKAAKGYMSPLLSSESGTDQNRACDGVLLRVLPIDENGETPMEVGYFDLKTGNPEGYEGQFLSTRCFMFYVFALLDTFYGVKGRLEKERFVIFHTDKHGKMPTMQKKPTRPSPNHANSAQNADKRIVKNEQRIPANIILS